MKATRQQTKLRTATIIQRMLITRTAGTVMATAQAAMRQTVLITAQKTAITTATGN
jgi:hypothetical protein